MVPSARDFYCCSLSTGHRRCHLKRSYHIATVGLVTPGDIERRTGLLRCYLSRVENGHTVPSLETLAKIAEAMEISLADFFPGTETPRDKETQKMLGELSQDEIRFLAEIKKYSTTLSDGDKRLVLAMIRKMATLIPAQAAQAKKPMLRRPSL